MPCINSWKNLIWLGLHGAIHIGNNAVWLDLFWKGCYIVHTFLLEIAKEETEGEGGGQSSADKATPFQSPACMVGKRSAVPVMDLRLRISVHTFMCICFQITCFIYVSHNWMLHRQRWLRRDGRILKTYWTSMSLLCRGFLGKSI